MSGDSTGMPAIEFVVAVAENDVIGKHNALPWHLPDDLKRFKAVTLGKPLLMGRKTFESIGKALPGRRNLILTSDQAFYAPGADVVTSVAHALELIRGQAVLNVIGGGSLFDRLLEQARRIHLTLVHAAIADGDTFFSGWHAPEWNWSAQERHDADARHAFAFTFATLQRR